MKPKTLVLRTAGTNCDEETAHAFELAGASAERVHLNRILERPAMVEDYQLLAFPGGFSYGDDIAAGRILANQIVHHLRDVIRAFVEAGKPVIGICNGFQVLVKTDLLPGPIGGRTGQTCTLAHNDSGRFIDRWVHLAARGCKCIWTQGIGPIELPIAHGEGKFVPADENVRMALRENDQIALVYMHADGARGVGSCAGGENPHNPNGSMDDIAGICDATGLILGLMPHPERFISAVQHPAWTSWVGGKREGCGLKMFRNALRHVKQSVGVGI